MSESERLLARIKELEEVLEPLVPYADVDQYSIVAKYNTSLPGWEERRNKVNRETMFMDSAMFKHIAHVYRKVW